MNLIHDGIPSEVKHCSGTIRSERGVVGAKLAVLVVPEVEVIHVHH